MMEIEEAEVKPRIKVLTLGVSDLGRSLSFYRDGMGLPTDGIIGQEFEDGAVVFFNINDDLILGALSNRFAFQRRKDHRNTGEARRGVHWAHRQV